MDFLSTRNDAAIRKELCGIRDSYHHYWDLLAELLQNSRDAINRKRTGGAAGPFFIRVSIDSKKNRVEVFDNGVGIPSNSLHEMLAPGGGDKNGATDEVGEKGVGLTYAVFSGDRFEVQSRVTGQAPAGGVVLKAQSWLAGVDKSVARPQFLASEALSKSDDDIVIGGVKYPLDSFTKISVAESLPPEGDVNLFTMTAPQVRLLLLTRTAVGVTRELFEDGLSPEFNVELVLDLPTGTSTETLPAKYVAPHTLVAANDRLRLGFVREAFVGKADPAARRKLLGTKSIWERTSIDIDGWRVDVYGVMFPANDSFKALAKDTLGIVSSDAEEESGNALFQSGIFVGTKGMPTGMRIEPKAGGRYPAYYKRCFFFVESKNLKFDLGRKSLHYKYTARLQSAVAELFKKFEEIAPFQGEGRPEPGTSQVPKSERQAQSQAEWEEALGLAMLGEQEIPYERIPNRQEAAVAAVFHELLGAGILKGYRTLSTGYSSRYDVHAHYHKQGQPPLKIIIEFKHDLEALVRDLVEKKKYFNDIDLLVAWDADEQKLKKGDFDLEAVPSGHYDGVTHMLTVPIAGLDSIPVILLRAFFDRRRASESA